MLLPFVVIALFFSIMIYQKYRDSYVMPSGSSEQINEGRRPVTLFFVKGGVQLVRETREIEPCGDDVTCLEIVLDELLNGPLGEFDEAVPEGVIVESVAVAGNQAAVGFNEAFSAGLLSGSAAEMVAVYSVVNTITVNFPSIKTVKINVGGNTGTVLRHLDLSDHLMPDYSLEQDPSQRSSEISTNPLKGIGTGAVR